MSYLHDRPELTVTDDTGHVDVVVFAAERFTPAVASDLRSITGRGAVPVVLVVNDFSETDLLASVECNVVAVSLRSEINAERLVKKLSDAAGGSALPSGQQSDLVVHAEHMRAAVARSRTDASHDLTPREIEVVKLLAEGFDTQDVAGRLHCSERTVKDVISRMINRLQLRNRAHAVAYAMRSGAL
jgi:DNA-binding NarL/FixJ family response regulator